MPGWSWIELKGSRTKLLNLNREIELILDRIERFLNAIRRGSSGNSGWSWIELKVHLPRSPSWGPQALILDRIERVKVLAVADDPASSRLILDRIESKTADCWRWAVWHLLILDRIERSPDIHLLRERKNVLILDRIERVNGTIVMSNGQVLVDLG